MARLGLLPKLVKRAPEILWKEANGSTMAGPRGLAECHSHIGTIWRGGGVDNLEKARVNPVSQGDPSAFV